MRVGLIGMGSIGYPLFQKFLKQKLKINILMDPFYPKQFEKATIFHSNQFHEFIEQSHLIFSTLPQSAMTLNLVSYIPKPASETKYWIDLCSSCPQDVFYINEILEKLGIEYMDAPVSGGPRQLIEGTLSTVISGPITCYQQAYDVISSYNQSIFYISGKVGTASAVKQANNTLVAANLISVAEVLTVLDKHNIDIDEALHFINNSSGKSWVSKHSFPEQILNNEFRSNFTYHHHQKDILTFLRYENLEDTHFLKMLAKIYGNPEHQFKDHTEVVKIVK